MWAVGLSVFNTVCAGNVFSGRGDVFLLLTNLYLRRLRNLAMEWRSEWGPLITSQVDGLLLRRNHPPHTPGAS